MKRFLFGILFSSITLFIVLSILANPFSSPIGHAFEATPSYAKWGQLAMKETKAKYPASDIIDYLHIGREVNDNIATEKFKLWLRDRSTKKEFGVFVYLKFNEKTEQLIKITYKETDR
jgi:hypothetical protein